MTLVPLGCSEGVAETESEGGTAKKLVTFVLLQTKITVPQIYHSNATTNVNIRQQIQTSAKTNTDLAAQFNTSQQTISKWKNRDVSIDLSSRPLNISYAPALVRVPTNQAKLTKRLRFVKTRTLAMVKGELECSLLLFNLP